MARLTAPNGVVVSVADGKADGLVARGYTTGKAPPAAKATTAEAGTEPVEPQPKRSGKSARK